MLNRLKQALHTRIKRLRQGELDEAAEIAFGGERVTHLYPNDVYYAHLSIYWFALQFTKGRSVLDAGCGDGYGTNYLADHSAASVVGIDISKVAIDACRKHFRRGNLDYRVEDLGHIRGFHDHSFDAIFSSNALEHVANPKGFFDAAHRLLRPLHGSLILAVPPVVDEASRHGNLINPYHLNIWTPRQWKSVLDMYFAQVNCYSHLFQKEDIRLDFGNTPEQTRIRETDFTFLSVELDDFYGKPPLTVIFVASQPHSRPAAHLEEIPMVDDSFTREASSGQS